MGDGGAFYLKVFDDDNGVPGAELYSHVTMGGDDGWNYYDLGDDQFEIYDTFWFAVKELSTTWPFGVDTDSDSGYSYVSADGGTTWEPLVNFGISGNLMLRLYLDQPSIVPDYSVTLTPYNPPIEIPAGGGTFDYNVQLANNTSNTQNFYAVLFAELPNGSQYGPIDPTPYSAHLSPGQTIDVDLTQNVPGNAPTGVYTYYCLVGTGYNSIMDSSGFTFTKLGTVQAAGLDEEWIGYYSDVGVEMRDYDLWTVDGIYREDGTLVYGSMSTDENLIPDEFVLYQNYPNPFNPVTTIRYDLPEQSYVTIVIYDMLGRTVRQLVNKTQDAGYKSVVWDASEFSSGLYFVKVTSGNNVGTLKVLLIK